MKAIQIAGLALVLGAGAFVACDYESPPEPAAAPSNVEHEPDAFGDSGEAADESAIERSQLVHSAGY